MVTHLTLIQIKLSSNLISPLSEKIICIAMHSKEILDGKEPTCNAFPYQIAFNVFNHNSSLNSGGNIKAERERERDEYMTVKAV